MQVALSARVSTADKHPQAGTRNPETQLRPLREHLLHLQAGSRLFAVWKRHRSFRSYPERFTGQPTTGTVSGRQPDPVYDLTTRDGGRLKHVHWDEVIIRPIIPAAARLRPGRAPPVHLFRREPNNTVHLLLSLPGARHASSWLHGYTSPSRPFRTKPRHMMLALRHFR